MFMKRLQRTIVTMTLLLLGLGVAAAQAEPRFAGAWVLDRAQSQFPAHNRPQRPDAQVQPPVITLTVEQQGATLKITRTMTMGTHERSTTDTLVADGTDQSRRGYRGQIVTRAVFESDRLVVTETHMKQGDQGDQSRSRQSIWTLSPDGQVLTIDTTMHSPRGDRAMRTVYQRS
jgi:hypothetical protein